MAGYLMGGHQERATRANELLLRTSPELEGIAAYVEALGMLGAAACLMGSRQQTEIALGRMVEVGSEVMEDDALVRGWLCFLKEQVSCYYEATPWQVYTWAEQARRDFSALGVDSIAIFAQAHTGLALAALGEVPDAVGLLRKALADARHKEGQVVVSHGRSCLSQVLIDSVEPAYQQEGHALVLEALACDEPDFFRRSTALAMLAKAMVGKGELPEAEAHAREACALLMPLLVPHRVYVRTVLSAVLLAQGRATEAREVAELGVRDLEQMRSQGMFAVAIHLALVEACFAQGDTQAGEAALRDALRCVQARASDIPEAAARERFLRQVPENARTLELARQRWGEPAV